MKQQIFTKARQRFGVVYPAKATEFAVEVVKNKSISVYKHGQLTNTFNIGDEAEYDSYNLKYVGRIISISDKRVVIEEPYKMYGKDHGQRHSLDLYKFCWRNYDFDAVKIAKHNYEESMYI